MCREVSLRIPFVPLFLAYPTLGPGKKPPTRKTSRWMAERAVTHRHTPRTEDEKFQRLKAAWLATSRSIFWLPIPCCEPLFSRRDVRRCMRMTRCQHTRGQDYALCALGNIVRSFDAIAPRAPSSNVAHNAVPRTPFALTRDAVRLHACRGCPTDWADGRRCRRDMSCDGLQNMPPCFRISRGHRFASVCVRHWASLSTVHLKVHVSAD